MKLKKICAHNVDLDLKVDELFQICFVFYLSILSDMFSSPPQMLVQNGTEKVSNIKIENDKKNDVQKQENALPKLI